MEVGCRVETEDMRTRSRRYTTKAYLTFVALDERGRPRPIPPLQLDTDEDRRRHTEGERRRGDRLRAAGRSAP
jgi:acyl-CoA hydrolase